MKKYLIMIIIAATVFAMTMSASADNMNPIQRITSREVGSEEGLINEPIIEPVSYEDVKDDLIIAPNPDTVVAHNAEDGERTIDDTIISPEPYNEECEEELIDSTSAFGTLISEGDSSKNGVGVHVLLVIGAVGLLLISLIILKKRG
jgi:hypothetical protein